MSLCVDRLRKSFVGSVLIVLLSSQGASGTVIYLRVSQDEVVIAADSKQIYPKPDGNVMSVRVCKIHQAGDVFFASAGVGGDEDTGFHVEQVVRHAINGEGDLLNRVGVFQQLIHIPLLKFLKVLRKQEPARYRSFLSGVAAQTVFIRVEKQSLVVVASIIKPVEDFDGTIKLDSVLFSCLSDCKLPNTFSIGASPRADDIERKTKNLWERGSVAGLRELMKVSIADRPEEAGEPIDILKITKSGATWAQVKQGCGENMG